MSGKNHTVLIADDYEADRLFLKEAIRFHAPRLDVVAEVRDGEQVIAYLSGQGRFADRQEYPLPDLLILDVRMPRMTGIEVVEWLGEHDFPSMKVALLADSSSMIFRPKAREMGVRHFYSKFTDELVQMVETLQTELESGEQG